MKRILFFFFFSIHTLVFSQRVEDDWENYIVSLNGKPVSINLNLAFESSKDFQKNHPFVIIHRVKLSCMDQSGMPKGDEREVLLDMENRMVEFYKAQCKAEFVGRFTQRGIREFYFYAADTLGYARASQRSMMPFPEHEWLVQAKKDESWDNYRSVLFPSDIELFRLRNRRKLETLFPDLSKERKQHEFEHIFKVPNEEVQKSLMQSEELNGFKIIALQSVPGGKNGEKELVVSKTEWVDVQWLEKRLVSFYQVALKKGGTYLGWNLVSK